MFGQHIRKMAIPDVEILAVRLFTVF